MELFRRSGGGGGGGGGGDIRVMMLHHEGVTAPIELIRRESRRS